jgi:hypothetical protein
LKEESKREIVRRFKKEGGGKKVKQRVGGREGEKHLSLSVCC